MERQAATAHLIETQDDLQSPRRQPVVADGQSTAVAAERPCSIAATVDNAVRRAADAPPSSATARPIGVACPPPRIPSPRVRGSKLPSRCQPRPSMLATRLRPRSNPRSGSRYWRFKLQPRRRVVAAVVPDPVVPPGPFRWPTDGVFSGVARRLPRLRRHPVSSRPVSHRPVQPRSPRGPSAKPASCCRSWAMASCRSELRVV
jgi:hypothetical protein